MLAVLVGPLPAAAAIGPSSPPSPRLGLVAAIAATGIERHPVELVGGSVDPFTGADAAGAIVAVPPGFSTMVIEAAASSVFAVRLEIGGRWGPWVDLASGGDEAPDADVTLVRGFGPVALPATAERVEVVRLRGADRSIIATFLPDAAQGTDAGPGPAVAGAQAAATGARPVIVGRSEWATAGWAFDTPGCERGPTYSDNLQAVVIHHTVTANTYRPDQVDDLLRAIYYSHVVVNGWCDIGYNFVVDRFGTIWEARTGGTDRPVIGGHAKGFNTSTMGVALLGQHQPGASPTAADTTGQADAAVQALAAWKLGLHGIDPRGTTWLRNTSTSTRERLAGGEWHRLPTIFGHRDVGLTSCPGGHGMDLVAALPGALDAGHPGGRPFVHAGWNPAEVGSGLVTVDGRGGIRPAGSATVPGIGAPTTGAVSPTPLPSPTVRAVAAHRTGTSVDGYVLGADGVLHPFGARPAVAGSVSGTGDAVDVALAPSGGWVVTATGRIVGFGGQPDRTPSGLATPVVGAALDAAGNGYLVAGDGRLSTVGAAPATQIAAVAAGGAIDAVDVATRPGGGGWVLAADGRLHPFGGTPPVERPIAGGSAPTNRVVAVGVAAGGIGGWVVTADGQIWPFGGARLIPAALTNAADGDIVDAAVVEPVVTPAFATSSLGRYLDAVVQLFLGRAATAADFDHWEGRYTYGGGRTPVTQGLAASEEWAGQRIDALYVNVLGRPGEPAGRRYWLDRMIEGLPLNQVGVYFYGSAEYRAQAPTPEAYVDRLYQVLLGRQAEPGGRAYWAAELTSGRAAPPDVVAGFYASEESRRSRVTTLYRDVLGRDPDPGGLSYWAQELLVRDDVNLAAELAASEEFHANALR